MSLLLTYLWSRLYLLTSFDFQKCQFFYLFVFLTENITNPNGLWNLGHFLASIYSFNLSKITSWLVIMSANVFSSLGYKLCMETSMPALRRENLTSRAWCESFTSLLNLGFHLNSSMFILPFSVWKLIFDGEQESKIRVFSILSPAIC